MNPAIEAAVAAYFAKLTPEQMARSDAYFEGGYWIQLWSWLLGLAIAWVLMRFGISTRIRDFARRISARPFLQDAIYVPIYLLFVSGIGFPFTLYTDYFREHRYGLSNQDFMSWSADFLKGGLVGLVLLTLFFVIVYKLIRRFTNSWWIWGAVATSVFFAITLVIAPVFISPLFNTYRPLEPGPVRDAVLLMAKSNGIPADEVWQFDASKQSNRVSANVSGLWGTTRISLNDNLLKRCDLREIRAVMGHEMGHYVMNHGPKTLVFFSMLWLVGFAFLSWATRLLLARHGAAWGVRSVGDIASLPVTVAALTTFSFLCVPIFNTIIRTQEVEADMFGLNLAREPDGMAEVALKLSEYRKMRPSRFEEFIFFDHPSGESRIRTALTWKEYLENSH